MGQLQETGDEEKPQFANEAGYKATAGLYGPKMALRGTWMISILLACFLL
jgi:hypothetical protein